MGTDHSLVATTLGRINSYYYLKYTSVALFHAELHDVEDGPRDLPTLLRVLCDASEFDELPVRHNEEHVNLQMSKELPWRLDERTMDSPHTKANLLLQASGADRPAPTTPTLSPPLRRRTSAAPPPPSTHLSPPTRATPKPLPHPHRLHV